MLSKEILKKIKRIHLHTKFIVQDVVIGEYQSAFKGQGMEFEEVREYVLGDDIRAIDWNVSAKMNAPYIKKYREERELTLYLLVDLSASQNFSSDAEYTKRDLATEIAATLAYIAIQNNDKVGTILFSDNVEKYIPPQKGRNQILRIIRDVLAYSPKNKGTNIKNALEFLYKIAHRKSVVFLISDFIDNKYEDILKKIAAKHELVVVNISDKREKMLVDVGLLELEDLETGTIKMIDTSDKRFVEMFYNLQKTKEQNADNFLKKNKIETIKISATDNYLNNFLAFFKKRSKHHKQFLVTLCLSFYAMSYIFNNYIIYAQEQIEEIADIKNIYDEKYWYKIWVLIFLITILVGFVTFILYKKYKNKNKVNEQKNIVIKISPYELAIKNLQELFIPQLIDNNIESKIIASEFYFKLISIFKLYIEQVNILEHATDYTTEEIMYKLKNNNNKNDIDWKTVFIIMQKADSVKFAEALTTTNDLNINKNIIENIINKYHQNTLNIQVEAI